MGNNKVLAFSLEHSQNVWITTKLPVLKFKAKKWIKKVILAKNTPKDF